MGDFSGVGDGGGACNSSIGSAGGAGSVGGADVGAEITDGGSRNVTPAVGGGSSEPETSVTATVRQRRRSVAGAMVVESKGVIEQISETSCRPVAWRIIKRAFNPLPIQRSYRARKSSLDGAAECVVCGRGRGFLARSPSQTILDHVGAGQECEGLAGEVQQ